MRELNSVSQAGDHGRDPRSRRARRRVARQAFLAVVGLAVAVAAVMAGRAVAGNRSAPSAPAVVRADVVPVTGSPIGPRAAAALHMAITAPARAQGLALESAKQAALSGWPGCTAGAGRYVHLLWADRDPATDADVFLIPLHCAYGMTAGQGVGPDGATAAQAPAATFKVAIVSASGALMETITGASGDAPPQ